MRLMVTMVLDLIAKADRVNSLEDFIEFLELYSSEIEREPDECENPMTSHFLGAMSAWIADVSQHPGLIGHDMLQDAPSWKSFAKMLLAAGVCE